MVKGHAFKCTMLSEQLLTHEDLLESLDAEPIFDYLLQHGILDKMAVDEIRNEKTAEEQNAALLHRLERHGTNAVPMFINALRHSGQVHLASTLDVSQRIRPVRGSGYWEKQRHKGQVVVKIQVKAIKVMASDDTPVKLSGRYPREIYEVKMTPRRLHKSYDNMLMLDGEDRVPSKSIRIIDYPYARDEEEEDDDLVKQKKSCWCMCFPMFQSRRKTAEKYAEKTKLRSPSHRSQSPPHDSKRKSQTTSPKKQKHNNSPAKGGMSGLTNSGERTLNGHSRTNSPLKAHRNENRNNINGRRNNHLQLSDNKENMDPVSMRYNEQLELVELKRYSHKSRPRENGMCKTRMCEKWKSEGTDFEKKSSEFYGMFDNNLKNSCIKYFEQGRGTLILQIFSDSEGITVFNICMTRDHVNKLRDDFQCGNLEEKLQGILIPSGTIKNLDILDMKLAVTIDDEQFSEAMEELS